METERLSPRVGRLLELLASGGAGKVVSATDAVTQAFERMNAGADAVYARMSPEWPRGMTQEHIPVVGHVGMIPQIRT